VVAATTFASASWDPFDFSTNHECGMPVGGHELTLPILENGRHPYYRPLPEGQVLTKAMDL
jgi:hypothetical protein